jgi:hypothetical protein
MEYLEVFLVKENILAGLDSLEHRLHRYPTQNPVQAQMQWLEVAQMVLE